MSEPAENILEKVEDFAADEMLGAMMKGAVEVYKEIDEPWHKLSQSKQEQALFRLDYTFKAIIRQAIGILAAQDNPTLQATIEKVEFKDGVKAQLSMSQHDEHRHALADAQGSTCLLVVVDPDDYMNPNKTPEADPDQPELV